MEREHTRLSLGVGVAGLALLAGHQTALLQSYPSAGQPPSSGVWGVWLLHIPCHLLLYLKEQAGTKFQEWCSCSKLFRVNMTGVPFGSSDMCSV